VQEGRLGIGKGKEKKPLAGGQVAGSSKMRGNVIGVSINSTTNVEQMTYGIASAPRGGREVDGKVQAG
jgi:hypothetical protein